MSKDPLLPRIDAWQVEGHPELTEYKYYSPTIRGELEEVSREEFIKRHHNINDQIFALLIILGAYLSFGVYLLLKLFL